MIKPIARIDINACQLSRISTVSKIILNAHPQLSVQAALVAWEPEIYFQIIARKLLCQSNPTNTLEYYVDLKTMDQQPREVNVNQVTFNDRFHVKMVTFILLHGNGYLTSTGPKGCTDRFERFTLKNITAKIFSYYNLQSRKVISFYQY